MAGLKHKRESERERETRKETRGATRLQSKRYITLSRVSEPDLHPFFHLHTVHSKNIRLPASNPATDVKAAYKAGGFVCGKASPANPALVTGAYSQPRLGSYSGQDKATERGVSEGT